VNARLPPLPLASVAHGAVVEAAYSLHSFTTSDADEHAAGLAQWQQTYDQLSPGRFDGQLTECWFGNVQIFREITNQTVHQTGAPWQGSRTLAIPMRMTGLACNCGQSFGSDTCFTLGPDDELDFRTAAELDIVAVSINAETLSQFSQVTEGRDIEQAFGDRGIVRVGEERMTHLRGLLGNFFEMLKTTPDLLAYPEVRKGLEHAVLTNLLAGIEGDRDEAVRRSTQSHRRVIDRAREYVLANTFEPVTIAEICEQIGVSRRTLQLCFQDVMGTNPVQYLRAIRLNAVRRELRRGQVGKSGIQDVAARWGFWHLSSFAADYKKMFGELPSKTLADAR
jgi:AraC family ethanolamine operon transcriptional activator